MNKITTLIFVQMISTGLAAASFAGVTPTEAKNLFIRQYSVVVPEHLCADLMAFNVQKNEEGKIVAAVSKNSSNCLWDTTPKVTFEFNTDPDRNVRNSLPIMTVKFELGNDEESDLTILRFTIAERSKKDRNVQFIDAVRLINDWPNEAAGFEAMPQSILIPLLPRIPPRIYY